MDVEPSAQDTLYSKGTRSVGESAEGVQAEIDMLRVVMRRLFASVGSAEEPAAIAITLEIQANVSTTIAGLPKSQRFIEGGQSALTDAKSQTLREVTGEFRRMYSSKGGRSLEKAGACS